MRRCASRMPTQAREASSYPSRALLCSPSASADIHKARTIQDTLPADPAAAMSEVLEKKLAEKIPALNPMRTHSRNVSWGGQGTPLSRKLSASPKVLSALASATSAHKRTNSLKTDFGPELSLDFRSAHLNSWVSQLRACRKY